MSGRRRSGRRPETPGRWMRWAAAACAVCLLSPPLAGQGEPVPLTRDDVVRLVTGDTYSERETVSMIRRSCVSFRLTENVLREFAELGAPDSVMDALRSCRRGPAPLDVFLSVGDTSVVRGDTLTLVAFVRREGEPVSGVDLTLAPSGGPPDGDGRSASGVTDGQGRARFHIPAEAGPDSTVFRVETPGREIRRRPELRLVTRPSPPAGRRSLARSIPADEEDELSERRLADGSAAPERDEAGEEDAARPDSATEGDRSDAAGPDEDDGREDDAGGGEPGVADTAAGGPGADRERAVEEGGRSEARRRLSAALRDVPGHAAELVELGESFRRAGDLRESATALRAAVGDDRVRAEAWTELGRTWAAAGRAEDARHAFLRARELADAPSDTAELSEELARVHGRAPSGRARALLGATLERDGGDGLRWADVRVRATPVLELTGRFEHSLGRIVPALTRGPAGMDHYAMGASLEWGEGGRYRTRVEAGRRRAPGGVAAGPGRDGELGPDGEPAPDGESRLDQNVYRVEQGLRLPSDLGSFRFSAGALVGRWFDRDDWLAYGRAEIPVAVTVDVTSSLYAGETVGTHFPAGLRRPAQEVRGYVGADVHPEPGLRIAPRIGVGSVEGGPEELGGGLWELLFDLSVPVASRTAIEAFVRHQSPPGVEPFTVVAAGLRVDVR